MKIYDSVSHAISDPFLIHLAQNHYVLSFPLMKLMPARYILEKAMKSGAIKSDTTIVESTSGTFGMALAQVCLEMDLPLILVADAAVDTSWKARIEKLGAKVHIVDEPPNSQGVQRARLDKLMEIRSSLSHSFWPQQYDNPDNPNSYRSLARDLLDTIADLGTLVGTVGSGGSMCGLGAAMRSEAQSSRIVGVDTHGSVLFGHVEAPRNLRGLGNSLHPKNVDQKLFDEVHWVTAAEAYCSAVVLNEQYGLYKGPTSGAAYLVGNWMAQKEEEKSVLTILPDDGFRYSATTHNDEWRQKNGFVLDHLPSAPELVSDPRNCSARWSMMMWNRRSLLADDTPVAATAIS